MADNRLVEAVRACRDAINSAATLLENVNTHRDSAHNVATVDNNSSVGQAELNIDRPPRSRSSDIVREFHDNFARNAVTGAGRRRSHRPRFRSRSEQRVDSSSNNRGRSTVSPTWTRVWVCVESTKCEWCPTPKQRSDLSKVGLGERRISIPIGSTATEVHDLLLDEYPKLSEGGGYEICRAYLGSRRLVVIPCPPEGYTQMCLNTEAGQAKLYIRPLQNDLEGTPVMPITTPSDMASTISAINNAPREMCSKCNVQIPFSQLRDHIDACRGLEVVELEDDEDSDRDLIPVQISSPERTTHRARQSSTRARQSSTLRGNHSGQNQDLTSARHCNMNTRSANSLMIALDRSYSQILDSTGSVDSQEENEEETIEANNAPLYPRCSLEYAVQVLNHQVEQMHLDYNKGIGSDYDDDDYQRINILRSNFWQTAVRAINRSDFHPNKPMKVSFIGESAVDDGGPRREFCSLLINAVKTSGVLEGKENNLSFSHDLHYLAERRYFTAGKMVAISLCHGGPGLHCLSQATFQYMAKGCVAEMKDVDEIPGYEIQLIAKQIQSSNTNEDLRIAVSRIGEESVANITGCTDPIDTITLDMKDAILQNLIAHHCVYKAISGINQFSDGMNILNVKELIKAEPGSMEHFMCFSKKLYPSADYFKAMHVEYSPSGSNNRTQEETTMYYWFEFIDECAKGNQKASLYAGSENESTEVVITLADILSFFTGAHSIPPLGFKERLSIEFITNSTVPTSNTCANTLRLPRYFSCIDEFSERLTFALANSRDFGNV